MLAFWVSALGTTALAGLLLCNGLFMGTVMGVVQVSVQSAAGPVRLGEAAASVQFSRSIGAAFGTALVATVLFAFLALRNPEAARVFASMVQHAGTGPALPAAQRLAIQADIRQAFRRRLFDHGGVLDRRVFSRAHQSAATDLTLTFSAASP